MTTLIELQEYQGNQQKRLGGQTVAQCDAAG